MARDSHAFWGLGRESGMSNEVNRFLGGTVVGSSDKISAYPASRPVGPWDVTATMYSCLGIYPSLRIRDRENRELSICRGQPIGELL